MSLKKLFNNIEELADNFKFLIISVTFILLGAIGYSNLINFGVAQDEYFSRFFGFVNLNYIGNFINPKLTELYSGGRDIPHLPEFHLNFYSGALFETVVSLIEILLGIEDKKYQFILRHFFIFTFFYLSLIFFYKICYQIFKNWKLSLLGVFFLFLSPRIFADSFYNNKDILFLSINIFSTYYFLRFCEKPNIKNSLFLAFFVSLGICFRIMGILTPMIFISIFILRNIKIKKPYENLTSVIFAVFSTIFFTYIMWPYLWESPIHNFLHAFASMKQYQHDGYNLYFGNLVSSKNVPWHYSITWILITTPILYLLLFFIGLASFFKKGILINNSSIIFYLSFFMIFITISSVILFNSTLYNGWRHLYFIYPFIILISLIGFSEILNTLSKFEWKIFIIILITIITLNTGFWMFKNNPYQYVYFNFIGKKLDQKNFDLDYWGLSNYQNLKFLIEYDKSNSIKIWTSSSIGLGHSLFSLSDQDRSRIIKMADPNQADYLISNYYLDNFIKDKNFMSNYELINSIIVDDVPINSLFKKK